VYHRSLYDVSLPLVVIVAFSTVICTIHYHHIFCTIIAFVPGTVRTIISFVASRILSHCHIVLTIISFVASRMISYRHCHRIFITIMAFVAVISIHTIVAVIAIHTIMAIVAIYTIVAIVAIYTIMDLVPS